MSKKIVLFLTPILIAALVAVLASGPAAAGGAAARDPALRAAKEWLALVDGGRYGESWDAAAAPFKTATTREGWEASLNQVRQPLGGLGSRSLRSAEYKTSLPGAPDGEYVVIEFATAYANKKSAVETIVPALEPDGAWRVSGYFIK